VPEWRFAAGTTMVSIPSSRSTDASYPVSSNTSRFAAIAGCSEPSIPPPGRVHPDLPARSSARAGSGPSRMITTYAAMRCPSRHCTRGPRGWAPGPTWNRADHSLITSYHGFITARTRHPPR
jgi:hypothetical protein